MSADGEVLMTMKRVCVFCGSSKGSDAAYMKSAQRLGQEIAKRDMQLVYGGARQTV